MTEGRLRQYIIMHKAFTPPADPSFVPLQVGFGEDLGYLRDNTKDNIASKNKSWCELTGLYWIWKTIPKATGFRSVTIAATLEKTKQ